MNLERYEILKLDNVEILYEFVSSGPKGDIKKAVLFTETNLHNFYNLGFGDLNEESKEIDDLAVTDNGDTQLILSTIAVAAL